MKCNGNEDTEGSPVVGGGDDAQGFLCSFDSYSSIVACISQKKNTCH